MNYSFFEPEEVITEELVDLQDADIDEGARLIVYNDDVNSFEWVINCFVKVLNHTVEQAEQLSYLIHFKGKAIVKQGSFKELKPKKDALCDCGLSAVIEE